MQPVTLSLRESAKESTPKVTCEFTRATATGPVKRGFAASGVDEVTATLYVFGGLTTPRQDSLVDGWTLQLTEE